MTSDCNYLTNLKLVSTGKVTLGDAAIGSIIGKGKLNVQGQPSFDDIMLVEGLTINLITISQLCDQGLQVSFIKEQCFVIDDVKTLVMISTREGIEFREKANDRLVPLNLFLENQIIENEHTR